MTTPLTQLNDARNRASTVVSSAETEQRETRGFLAALEERVRQGDKGVRPDELAKAGELVGFAGLRLEAAQRQAEQIVTDARHALYTELGREARAFNFSDDVTIVEAFRAALDALHELWGAAAERSRRLTDLAGRATFVAEEAKNHNEKQVLRAAGINNAEPRSMSIVSDSGQAHRVADVWPHEVMAATFRELLREVEADRRNDPSQWVGNHFNGAPWDSALWGSPLTEALREFGSRRAAEEFPAFTAARDRAQAPTG